MPTGLVSVLAIVILTLGVAIVILSFLASFEPESAQWLSVVAGLVNIALGFVLLYVSTNAGKSEGV